MTGLLSLRLSLKANSSGVLTLLRKCEDIFICDVLCHLLIIVDSARVENGEFQELLEG